MSRLRQGLFVLLLSALASCGDNISYVERVVIVNRTNYDLIVDVRGRDGSSWLPLGIAHHRREEVFESVIDQGPAWVFRFSYARNEAGQVSISRTELVRANWRLEVPHEAAERLQARGVPAPP